MNRECELHLDGWPGRDATRILTMSELWDRMM